MTMTVECAWETGDEELWGLFAIPNNQAEKRQCRLFRFTMLFHFSLCHISFWIYLVTFRVFQDSLHQQYLVVH